VIVLSCSRFEANRVATVRLDDPWTGQESLDDRLNGRQVLLGIHRRTQCYVPLLMDGATNTGCKSMDQIEGQTPSYSA